MPDILFADKLFCNDFHADGFIQVHWDQKTNEPCKTCNSLHHVHVTLFELGDSNKHLIFDHKFVGKNFAVIHKFGDKELIIEHNVTARRIIFPSNSDRDECYTILIDNLLFEI